MKEKESIDRQVKRFFKKNPNLKKAMGVFDMSMKEYTEAISALTKKNIVITSTNTNGDMGGNQ